jgi:hypothetical protein
MHSRAGKLAISDRTARLATSHAADEAAALQEVTLGENNIV